MVGVNYDDAINSVEGIPKRYVLVETKFPSFRLENKERSFTLDKLNSVLSLTNQKHGGHWNSLKIDRLPSMMLNDRHTQR